jgi:hypothetical protein
LKIRDRESFSATDAALSGIDKLNGMFRRYASRNLREVSSKISEV